MKIFWWPLDLITAWSLAPYNVVMYPTYMILAIMGIGSNGRGYDWMQNGWLIWRTVDVQCLGFADINIWFIDTFLGGTQAHNLLITLNQLFFTFLALTWDTTLFLPALIIDVLAIVTIAWPAW
jgi:hypothetical protein